MREEEVVTVRLEDLHTIADATGTMKHDLDNGRTKYLRTEIERIHTVVERWAMDEAVLGGAECHDDHRCRLCQDFSVLPELPGRQPAVARLSGHRDSQHSETPGQSGRPGCPTLLVDVITLRDGVMEMGKKRHYNNRDAEFMLEPLSNSVVKVTHREQTGAWEYRDSDHGTPSIVLDSEENNLSYGEAILFVHCFDRLGIGPRLEAFIGFWPTIGLYSDSPGIFDNVSVSVIWGNEELQSVGPAWWKLGHDTISPPDDDQDAFVENLSEHRELRIAVPKGDNDVVLARFRTRGFANAVQPVARACQ